MKTHRLVVAASLFANLVCAVCAEPVRGVVKSVDAGSGKLTLTREDTKADITGFAPAGDLAPERVGTVVAGEWLPSGNDGKVYHFEQLRPADKPGETRIAQAAARLNADTRERGGKARRDIGDTLPEFALRDQFGRVFTNADVKGKYVVVSFIFTGCRSDEMCPASTRKMVELSKKLKDAGVENIVMLSISFDPANDTSGVLKGYGDGFGANGETDRFLTGPAGEIRDLEKQFGIQTVRDDGTIIHNVVTTVATPAGRILHVAEGPRWEAGELLARIVKHRSGQ